VITIVIEKLLQTPFSSFRYNEKLKIIEEGAPKLNSVNVPVLSTFTYCSYQQLFSSFTTLSFDGYKIVSIITCYFNTLA
jgi:hypothetical protein